MFSRAYRVGILFALAMTPATQAPANDGLVGGIIGGLIGGAVMNSGRTTTRTTTVRTVNPARSQNRETQTALNYFGFNAGTPDGALGPRSRAAISSYQAYLGFPVTGRISTFERDILVAAFARGSSGSYDAQQLIARDRDGVKALLVAQKTAMTGGVAARPRTAGYAGLPIEVSRAVDEIAESSDPSPEQLLARAGFIQMVDLNADGTNDYIIDTRVSGSDFWCNQIQCKTIVFASNAEGYRRNNLLAFSPTPATFRCYGSSCEVVDAGAPVAVNATIVPQPAQPVAPALPPTQLAVAPAPVQPVAPAAVQTVAVVAPAIPTFNLAVPTPEQRSLSSYCSKVGLLSGANGGLVEVSADSNPTVALGEQFCLGRAFAIDNAETMISKVVGVTSDQIEAQCAGFGPVMRPYVTALTEKPHTAVLGDVAGFVLNSGMTPSNLQSTGTICLGIGYRTDDMEAALGSALLLTALDGRPYAELVGHHLMQGFGTASSDVQSAGWFEVAFSALEAGVTPVFASEIENRVGILRWALAASDGAATAVVPAAAPVVGLPAFSVSE